MAWPDFTPIATPEIPYPKSARFMLEQIISRCDGWLATHPVDPPGTPVIPPPAIPASERQRWERIRTDAQLCLANSPHDGHHLFIDDNGQPKPNTALNTPWEHVRQCRLRVYQAAPSMLDLEMAIDYIDHLGGGGIIGASMTLQPPTQVFTGRWPDFGVGEPMITARTYLDAILAHCVGQLTRAALSAPLRKAYLELTFDAFLDRSNVAHGKLRTYVRQNGTAACAGGLRVAWLDVGRALEVLNAYTVTATDVATARKLVQHVH